MPDQNVAAIVEEFPIKLEDLELVLYHTPLWERISPVTRVSMRFEDDHDLFYDLVDEQRADLVGLVKVPVKLKGIVRFEELGEGVLGFEAVKCDEVESFSGRVRYRSVPGGTKLGIFVQDVKLSRAFLDLIGGPTKIVVLKVKLKQTFRKFRKLVQSGEFARIVGEVRAQKDGK
ncbi:MAG: hypothetical protein ACTSU5_21035 [Promethearchaeota archaeon]